MIVKIQIWSLTYKALTKFSFIRHTFVLRKPGESPNDRNDRAIRKIVQFYNEHLKQQGKILLIILIKS